jgi:hypothetical protein
VCLELGQAGRIWEYSTHSFQASLETFS